MIRFDNVPPEIMQAMCTPMHEILPRTPPSPAHPKASGALWLGSLNAIMDGAELAQRQIGHVVQVLDTPWLPDLPAGVTQYRMDVLDVPSHDLRPHLEGACDDIARALGRGENVLVHCQQGISRSAAVVIAYLIRTHAMTYEHAHALVKSKRACIKPNAGFVACLQEWEKQWRPKAAASMARRHTTR